jgi:hypothetical protein
MRHSRQGIGQSNQDEKDKNDKADCFCLNNLDSIFHLLNKQTILCHPAFI